MVLWFFLEWRWHGVVTRHKRKKNSKSRRLRSRRQSRRRVFRRGFSRTSLKSSGRRFSTRLTRQVNPGARSRSARTTKAHTNRAMRRLLSTTAMSIMARSHCTADGAIGNMVVDVGCLASACGKREIFHVFCVFIAVGQLQTIYLLFMY